MKRIRYIDTPFASQSGGDKNRSRFLWELLSSRYEADLLLLSDHAEEQHRHSGYSEVLQLPCQSGRGLQPAHQA
jgi:hypothetical protein